MRNPFKRASRPKAIRAPSGREIRELETAEGVALQLELASVGERIAAFALDMVIQFFGILAVSIGVGFLSSAMDSPGFWIIFVMLFTFLGRNFYFIFFELRWAGQTPGKRAAKIRVINRGEGRLTADAIFARNLLREIELFLPLTLLMAMNLTDGASGWTITLAAIWTTILLLFPLFNRDNLRAGDLIAGTLVVHKNTQALLADAAEVAEAQEEAIHFTSKQLSFYGEFELQKLEDIMRSKTFWSRDDELKRVAQTIAKKIGWEGDEPETQTRSFLSAFYAAQRNQLEGRMLMGNRRASKHDDASD